MPSSVDKQLSGERDNRIESSVSTERHSIAVMQGPMTNPESNGAQRHASNDFSPASGMATEEHGSYSSGIGDSNNKILSASRPWYRKINPLRWGDTPPVPTEPILSREYTASVLSLLTLHWITPLMRIGYKRPLEESDIWNVHPDREAGRLVGKLKANLKSNIGKASKRPLFSSLWAAFRFKLWLGGICALAYSTLQTLSPFVLRYLIQFATDLYTAKHNGTHPPPLGRGIGLAIGITLMQVAQSFFFTHFIYHGMVLGGECRAVLVGMIYEKAFAVSARAKAGSATDSSAESRAGEPPHSSRQSQNTSNVRSDDERKENSRHSSTWTNSDMIGLMSVDTFRIDQTLGLFHLAWTTPLTSCLTIVLLIYNIGYSALVGCGVLLFGTLGLVWAVKTLFRRREKINKITTQRVSLIQEIVHFIRFIKSFGCEANFVDRLTQQRNAEIRAVQGLQSVRNAITAGSTSLPVFASVLSFITYSLTGSHLVPSRVFSSLALFNSLATPLYLLPPILGQMVDSWSSLKRIEEFISLEESTDDYLAEESITEALEFRNASFTWEQTPSRPSEQKEGAKGSLPNRDQGRDITAIEMEQIQRNWPLSTAEDEWKPFQLRDMNFTVGRTELIAVIGSVGCGKSSLLAAANGDMRKISGEVILGGSRASALQQVWIENTSVQKNITFGKPLNVHRYHEVVNACCLQQDFDALPKGDQTETGEQGVALSGGQKQRINIARAIYFDTDVVLLDDPLSAVDAHVGRHIFDHAILGLLKNKCRLLTTNQPWVLPRCDRVVWMDGGQIRAIGPFAELMSQDENFRLMMEATEVEGEIKYVDETNGQTTEQPPIEKGDPVSRTDSQTRDHPDVALMQEEKHDDGPIPLSLYTSFLRASGSILNGPLIIFFLVLFQGLSVTTSIWLSFWTSDRFGYSNGTYIGIYIALAVAEAIFAFVFSTVVSLCATNASKTMLRDAVISVIRAPMYFFDSTPVGRITSRFSTDVDVLDNFLPESLRLLLSEAAVIVSVFALVVAYYYYFVFALIPLSLLYVIAAGYYRASARHLRRHRATLRSAMHSKFNEGLTGVSTIKAYGLTTRFIHELYVSIDRMNAASFLTVGIQWWVSLCLDMIGSLLILIVALLVVTSRLHVNPATIGLVLSYMISAVQNLQFTVRRIAEVENGMNAAERLHYFVKEVDQETTKSRVQVSYSWPERGEIIFKEAEMRYRADLPVILHNISLHISAGEQFGIVGRTGAGKSSITATLLRLVELSNGAITIDGIDIARIDLGVLRSRFSIIPQDPILFQGTIRSNLDLFQEHTDQELWSVLRQVNLVTDDEVSEARNGEYSSNENLPRFHLDSEVVENGLNYSLGQRQLLALARALVRESQIVICDEATSSLDIATDYMIQNTMASAFRGKTLLCIAHRLHTIIGYDRVCVMDNGRIAELGAPSTLFSQPDSIFRGMCDQSGISVADIQAAQNS